MTWPVHLRWIWYEIYIKKRRLHAVPSCGSDRLKLHFREGSVADISHIRKAFAPREPWNGENRRIFQLVRDLQSLKKRQNSCYRRNLRAHAFFDNIRKAFAPREPWNGENRRIFQLVRDLQSLKKRQNSCYRRNLRAHAFFDMGDVSNWPLRRASKSGVLEKNQKIFHVFSFCCFFTFWHKFNELWNIKICEKEERQFLMKIMIFSDFPTLRRTLWANFLRNFGFCR